LPYDVEVIKLKDKTWTNVAPVYNTGFLRARDKGADIIIIQSAECYHVGDVISHANEHCRDQYIAYGCFQIDKDTTFKDHDILKLSKTTQPVDGDNKGKGMNAWWNHSTIHPIPQYWGASISVENLKKVNGIDERFAFGYAFEDGWFLFQLQNVGIKIESVDYPFVVHQWHDRLWANRQAKKDPTLLEKNRDLYLKMIETKEYKSIHYITEDL
jgi:hypothetical protein